MNDPRTYALLKVAPVGQRFLAQHIGSQINSVAFSGNNVLFGGEDGCLKLANIDNHEYNFHRLREDSIQ